MRRLLGLILVPMLILPAAGRAANVCVPLNSLKYTDSPDDRTVLFHMKDGSVIRSDLPQRCFNLHQASSGISYEPTDPGGRLLCGGLSSFRVLDGQGGSFCQFGPFTRVK